MAFDAADAPRLLPGAIAVAVIGLMEATAIGRSIAATSGQRLDANREFVGQGVAGIASAFFQGYASSGSPSRTAVNYLGGARTRMAGVYGGLFVALAMLLFAPVAEAIPIPSLAGMLMVVAFQMIDRRRLRQAWRAGRESATILLVTLVATILLRIDVAIFIGVFTSLAFYIKRSSATEVSALVGGPRGKFREVPLDSVPAEEVRGEPLLVNVVGPLYFGALDEHRPTILRLVDGGACAVVIRLRRVSALDSSAIEGFEHLHGDLARRSVPLVLCGVDEETSRVFERTRLMDRLGRDRVIPASDTLFDSFLETVRLARRLAGKPEPGKANGHDEPLTWHI
jgi:SulP family sulfate permease